MTWRVGKLFGELRGIFSKSWRVRGQLGEEQGSPEMFCMVCFWCWRGAKTEAGHQCIIAFPPGLLVIPKVLPGIANVYHYTKNGVI